MNKLEHFLKEVKGLVSEGTQIVVFHNNEVAFSNINCNYQTEKIVFDKSGSYNLFYLVDQSININYEIKPDVNVNILEIIHSTQMDSTIIHETTLFKNASLNIVSLDRADENIKVKKLAKTMLYENSYIKTDNLSIVDACFTYTNDYFILEKNVTVQIENAIINSCGQHQTYNHNVHHLVSNSSSNMITYGVCKNGSTININTDGIIKKNSFKTKLNQKTKGIILDDGSQISANPILEIDEYDVEASHGASIGDIDEDELFYMMSRGLTRIETEKLIVNGLFAPFINAIKEEKAKKFIVCEIDNYLLKEKS